jgi:murein DD-endopeptidase MepM/ murein hydrolase activator NlpD
MDISDGSAPGTTPVKPFRSGVVIEAVHSAYGLGNHVIVDHGSGVTSVYAHLNSISVQVGQKVSLGTTIGMQGTTGVSTGTHLHFEIRVNGKAANPMQFISGQP